VPTGARRVAKLRQAMRWECSGDMRAGYVGRV